ncbi:uncharacterized protein [Dysidea avara]|uniref:uncharacterized protein n=1 Tax=Dysidea avara TaxID=196820 RepID=UPI003320DF0D
MRGLDETGVVVAGCRHIIAQKAVNMFRGEIYGYTHFLHMTYLTHRNLSYLIHDVICKYWPWTSSVHYSGNSSGNEMIPCLPVMHAKAHTWHCQVLWGARWQDGAGAGSGEDMELFFSYISRWSPSTKCMLAYRMYLKSNLSIHFHYTCTTGREDFLTEATDEKLLTLEGELNTLRVTSSINTTEDSLHLYKANIQAVARGELNKEFSERDNREQYFKLWKHMGIATSLTEFSASSDIVDSIILESAQLYKEATSVVSRSQTNTVRLRELEELLLIVDDASREQCLQEGKQLAIKTCLEHFQADMEMLFLSIKKKQVNVQNLATSSKQRAHLRHSVATEKNRLATCVDKYNQLCGAAVDEYHTTSVESILDGDFPW